MNQDKIIEALLYALPALVSGVIAVYYFKEYTKSDAGLEKFKLIKEGKKQITKLKLQAYERLTLFLERTALNKLVTRVHPVNDNKQAYAMALIHTIEKEFEHNITQQIYISEELWNIVQTAKNRTIQIIREFADKPEIKDAQQLREAIINYVMEKQSPSDAALSILKSEVNKLF
jgi:Tfp pilus assembly major pilin PilA